MLFSIRPCALGPTFIGLSVLFLAMVGCSGLFQNIGARWVTRQVAEELDLDEAQTEATRAAVDRLIAAAPEALGTKTDMLVATVDAAIAQGLTENKLRGMERQVDRILDIVAAAIIDEFAPILSSLRDEQIDFAEARIRKRLDEARDELGRPERERLQRRQDELVDAVEDWVGSLRDAQDSALRGYVMGLTDESAARLATDARRVETFSVKFHEHPGPQAIRDALWKEWKNREDWGPHARPPEVRRAEGRQTLLRIYGLLDSGQKAHASEHLHELHTKLKAFLGSSQT